MTTKPFQTSASGFGAVIAAVVIIGASFLGFHAFKLEPTRTPSSVRGTRSPQSDSIAQSGSQSGDTPQSAEPTPAKIEKPTPPKGLQEGVKSVHRLQHYGL